MRRGSVPQRKPRRRGSLPGESFIPLLLAGWALLLPPSIAAAGRLPSQEPTVYVSLSETARRVEISCDGPFRIGRWGTHRRPTRVDPGRRWRFQSAGKRVRVIDHLGRERGAFRERLFIFPEDSRHSLALDGARYRGEILVEPLAGGTLRVVNALGLEGYLKGVLPAEVGRLGEEGFAALKAQAVAARSYTLYKMRERRAGPFDLFPTEADQVYLGLDGEDPRANEAVDATWGIVALYAGQAIRANYCSTCGGRTADAGAVWPAEEESFPYLRARRDRRGGQDFCRWSRWYRWEESWACDELYAIVRRNLRRAVPGVKGGDPGRVTKLTVQGRTPSGRVAELEVETASGSYRLHGDQVRWVVRCSDGRALPSILLGELRRESDGDRCRLILEGAGFGHGVGLCQTGAIEMSRQGYTYLQILGHYYHDITVRQIYDGRRGRR
ncbi:MAG: SpoIID/LytB domain-containing protein [Candidatus Eisenbacteria bacterium]|nr:SpoIID/LytB domain-containing protein [Candidatus Eisenbacteria bacterium]